MDPMQQKGKMPLLTPEQERILADVNKRCHEIGVALGELRDVNMQTRHRHGQILQQLASEMTEHKTALQRCFDAVNSLQRQIVCVTQYVHDEIKVMNSQDRDITEMFLKYHPVKMEPEKAKIDRKIAEIEKKVEERKKQLAQLVAEKERRKFQPQCQRAASPERQSKDGMIVIQDDEDVIFIEDEIITIE